MKREAKKEGGGGAISSSSSSLLLLPLPLEDAKRSNRNGSGAHMGTGAMSTLGWE